MTVLIAIGKGVFIVAMLFVALWLCGAWRNRPCDHDSEGE